MLATRWVPTDDWTEVIRLHAYYKRGLYELANQYGALRPSDFPPQRFHAWIRPDAHATPGYAIAEETLEGVTG